MVLFAEFVREATSATLCHPPCRPELPGGSSRGGEALATRRYSIDFLRQQRIHLRTRGEKRSAVDLTCFCFRWSMQVSGASILEDSRLWGRVLFACERSFARC